MSSLTFFPLAMLIGSGLCLVLLVLLAWRIGMDFARSVPLSEDEMQALAEEGIEFVSEDEPCRR